MNFSSKAISVTRNIFRQITPPILFKILPHFKKSLGTDTNTYEGVFDSFETVIKSYGNQPQYSTELTRTQSLQNLRMLISLYDSKTDFTPGWSSMRFNFISSFVSSLEFNVIGILDIGGGYGETYLHLKQTTVYLKNPVGKYLPRSAGIEVELLNVPLGIGRSINVLDIWNLSEVGLQVKNHLEVYCPALHELLHSQPDRLFPHYIHSIYWQDQEV